MIRFVEQSVEPWGLAPTAETEALKLIERAGRTAYKSVSGRWSGWKHFIELRDSSAAHPRMQKIARSIREYFETLGLTV